MARVTVEDCVVKVPNRFELVLLAAQRSRALAGGATPTIERENDKNPVIALREIAEATVDPEKLRQLVVSGLQKHVEIDEPEDDYVAILAAAEKEWSGVTDDNPCGPSPKPSPSPKPEPTVDAAGKSDDDADGEAKAAVADAAGEAVFSESGTDPKPDEV